MQFLSKALRIFQEKGATHDGRTGFACRVMHFRLATGSGSLRLFLCRRWPCQRQFASSQFNGVYWREQQKKYVALVRVNGKLHYAGYFDDELRAAEAYDARLRELCQEGARLKKSLNFPTDSEVAFVETPVQARTRALRLHSDNAAKEDASRRILEERFTLCPEASEYEIVWIPGFSRIDALFQPKGSAIGGTRLQLKSSSPARAYGRSYAFTKTDGYGGMLLILVALDRGMIWAVPGEAVTQKTLMITLDASRDKAWRVCHIGTVLRQVYHRSADFPHASLSEARYQTSDSHRVEVLARLQLKSVLSLVGSQLQDTYCAASATDTFLLNNGYTLRVQEKASNLRKSGYAVNLRKHGGALGVLAYAVHDFDLLLAAILDEGRLCGLYLFPISALLARGLVGTKPRELRLYPPWALPKQPTALPKHAWQLEYFVDLRDQPVLTVQARSRLLELLDKHGSFEGATGSELDLGPPREES